MTDPAEIPASKPKKPKPPCPVCGLPVAECICLVRATTRYAIDLRRPKDHPDRARCDALHAELRAVQRELVTAANAAVRARWRVEGQALDDLLLQTGGAPFRGKDWPMANLNDYATIRAVAPHVASGICAAVSQAIRQKWAKERWDALVRSTRSPPHFSATMPISLRAAEVEVAHDGGGYWLRLTLRAGHRFALPLVPRDGWQRDELRNLAEGGWRIGEAKIQEDRLRPRKWYVRVAYKRKVLPSTGTVEAAINRGIKCFVAAVVGKPESYERWLYDGADIEAYLAQVKRRRQSYQRQSRAAARGGHGRNRILRPIEHLTGKAERWRETRNQVIAARLSAWLHDRGVGRVYLEDFTGIRDGEPEKMENGERVWRRVQEWPYYQLELALRSALEAYGIEVVTEAPHYISREDPRDGSAAERDLRHWKLRAADGKAWHLDVGAALNILRRGQARRASGAAVNEEPGALAVDKGAESGENKKVTGGEKHEAGVARKSNGKGSKEKGSDGTSRDGKK
jgi:hypothetical protein